MGSANRRVSIRCWAPMRTPPTTHCSTNGNGSSLRFALSRAIRQRAKRTALMLVQPDGSVFQSLDHAPRDVRAGSEQGSRPRSCGRNSRNVAAKWLCGPRRALRLCELTDPTARRVAVPEDAVLDVEAVRL